jgi:hypothetical protein
MVSYLKSLISKSCCCVFKLYCVLKRSNLGIYLTPAIDPATNKIITCVNNASIVRNGVTENSTIALRLLLTK